MRHITDILVPDAGMHARHVDGGLVEIYCEDQPDVVKIRLQVVPELEGEYYVHCFDADTFEKKPDMFFREMK